MGMMMEVVVVVVVTITMGFNVSALSLSYADRTGARVLPLGDWLLWAGPSGRKEGRAVTLRVRDLQG